MLLHEIPRFRFDESRANLMQDGMLPLKHGQMRSLEFTPDAPSGTAYFASSSHVRLRWRFHSGDEATIFLTDIRRAQVKFECVSVHGTSSFVEIVDLRDWGWEGVRYRVHEFEWDLFDFLCADVFAIVD